MSEHSESGTLFSIEEDRKELIELRLASYSKRMSDGHLSVFMRTDEEAADIVLQAGFRRRIPECATCNNIGFVGSDYLNSGDCPDCNPGVLDVSTSAKVDAEKDLKDSLADLIQYEREGWSKMGSGSSEELAEVIVRLFKVEALNKD